MELSLTSLLHRILPHRWRPNRDIMTQVPLPRGATALRWLSGQPESQIRLQPRVYFSPRRSSAPDTPGGAAVAAASAGAGAVAGVGAAWLWQVHSRAMLLCSNYPYWAQAPCHQGSSRPSSQFCSCDLHILPPWENKRSAFACQGTAGQPLGSGALGSMAPFLSEAAPRVRVLGGARFDGREAAPSHEWAPFGSYCFLLPRLELLEAAGCALLACTLAWRPQVGEAERCAVVQKLQAVRTLLAHPCPHSRAQQHAICSLCMHRAAWT